MLKNYKFSFKNFINTGVFLTKNLLPIHLINELAYSAKISCFHLPIFPTITVVFRIPTFPSITTIGRKNFFMIFYLLVFYLLVFYYFIFIGFDEDFILAIMEVFFSVLFYKNILISITIYIEKRVKSLKESLVNFLYYYRSRISILVLIYNSFVNVLFNSRNIINYMLYRIFSLISIFFKYYLYVFRYNFRFIAISRLNSEFIWLTRINYYIIERMFELYEVKQPLPSYCYSTVLNQKSWFNSNIVKSFYEYPIFLFIINNEYS